MSENPLFQYTHNQHINEMHNEIISENINIKKEKSFVLEKEQKKPKKNINNIKSKSQNNDENINKEQNFKKCKLVELKSIAKQHKIPVTGKKETLIRKIEKRMVEITNAIKIQKVFRGKIVRFFFNSRGPAIKNRSICVNDTDGFTLEPLKDIPHEQFYSFTDSNNYVYGFDLFSLLQAYRNKGKIINPYTRVRLDNNLLHVILSLGRIMNILFPQLVQASDYGVNMNIMHNPLPTTINTHHTAITRRNENNVRMQALNTYNRNFLNTYNTTNPHEQPNSFTPEQIELYDRIREIKTRAIERRINDLFIEIDLLGNYTQSSWFSVLEKRDYIRYYRILHDLWLYRARMSQETKNNICPFGIPFSNLRILININDVTREQAQEACLSAMENIVYSGVDVEYRKLGALHVLSVLTVVSIPARNSMNWLYESLMY